MSFFDMLFGGGESPADAARPFLEQVGPTMKPYYEPYIDSGRTALSDLQEQIKKMLTRPQDIYSQIGNTYSQSPGYRFSVDEATKAAGRAASAGGYAGTPTHQKQLANYITQLSNQDFNNYMNHNLGIFGQGYSGLNHLNDQGFNASTGFANNLGSNLMSQANMAYSGAQQKNQNNLDLFQSMGAILPYLI